MEKGHRHTKGERERDKGNMRTRERQEERLNLLEDEDPDPKHLDQGDDSQGRERCPRTANGPAQRSMSEKKGQGAVNRESDRHMAWTLVLDGQQTNAVREMQWLSESLQYSPWQDKHKLEMLDLID